MREVFPKTHLRMARFVTGERFPLVLDNRGIPLAAPTTYLTRLRTQALTTLEDKARTLAIVHNFMDAYGIDLRMRVLKGRILDPWEIEALSDCLRSIGLRTEAIRARAKLHDTSYESRHTVQGHEWHRRRLRASAYLAWLVDELTPTLSIDNYQRIQNELKKLQIGLVPDLKRSDKLAPRALSNEQGFVLLDAIRPGSELNPFPKTQQFRNFALITTYWQLGLRRSEVLALRCEDLSDPDAEHVLKLVRRPDDPDEPRARPPSIKTMPRPLPITPILHGILWEYFTYHRRMTEVKLRSRGDMAAVRRFKANPYLFVSSTGSPLSSSSVYKIFDTLRMRVADLPIFLSPHVLRRTWNDLFLELGREDGGDARRTRLREFLMGWVKGSRQAARYAQRAIQREAGDAILEMQREMMKPREENPNDDHRG